MSHYVRCSKVLFATVFTFVLLRDAHAQEASNSPKDIIYTNRLLSFPYPDNYRFEDLSDQEGPSYAAYSPGGSNYYIGVFFKKGFVNATGSGSGNQCEGVDKELQNQFHDLVKGKYSNFAKVNATYPRLGPGRRGGRSMDVDIKVTRSDGREGGASYYFNAIPYKNGLYILSFSYPLGTSMDKYQEMQKSFVDKVVMKDEKLPSTEYCSDYQ